MALMFSYIGLLLSRHFSPCVTGDRNKGWYYGENVRTGKRGWFPLAYTEPVKDADVDSGYVAFLLCFLFLSFSRTLFCFR